MTPSVTSNSQDEPVFSEFHGELEFHDLLEFFHTEIPERKNLIMSSVNNHDMAQLERLAHQIKGAGGGYGYPQLSKIAATLELSCKNQNDELTIRNHANELTLYLDRILQACPSLSNGPCSSKN